MLLSELIDILYDLYEREGEGFVFAEDDSQPVVEVGTVYYEDDEWDEEEEGREMKVVLIVGTNAELEDLN
jgi:hypothetical protein